MHCQLPADPVLVPGGTHMPRPRPSMALHAERISSLTSNLRKLGFSEAEIGSHVGPISRDYRRHLIAALRADSACHAH